MITEHWRRNFSGFLKNAMATQEAMATWSDKQKFWAETARTITLAVIGAIAAILLLRPAENRVQYQAELEKTRLAIMAKVVDEFLAASHRYTAVAYDACHGDAKSMEIFQGEGFDDFQSAKNRLSVYFGDV